jgi:hypothetical protein
MKAKLTLHLEGEFPGSPEKDSVNINLEEYDALWDLWIKPKAISEGWCGLTPRDKAELKQREASKQSEELISLERFNRNKRKVMKKAGLVP